MINEEEVMTYRAGLLDLKKEDFDRVMATVCALNKERERSAKLIEVLKYYSEGGMDSHVAEVAIQEHESSNDR